VRGQITVSLVIVGDIGIKEKDGDAANLHHPCLERDGVVADLNRDEDSIPFVSSTGVIGSRAGSYRGYCSCCHPSELICC